MSKKGKEKSQSKLLIFFMVIVIPIMFAIILAVVLLYFLGYNVSDTARQLASSLPFIESEEETLSNEEYIAQLEHENRTLEQEVTQLTGQVTTSEETIASLEEELLVLREGLPEDEEGEEGELSEALADYDDVIRTLESMTSSRAATIMEQLSEEEAVLYFRGMNVNSRSDILSRMDAELAASIISQLSN
ncbi:hypothetical protein FLK61_32565 [Paenalkalicoccus suaedae]|uniref:Magnesium transporter MgtE intracellular domain-containing protein n=1 Tax=Paenalkalicoccus suaedae TaxID=2592382 RepID=A0A859FGU4_9BACI|nr:hypothetical protein [Paenalkalicoccus suaedae]QKS71436.1 hypothetical protein FLK61_32565 [Paenalkalicoccus suaedae]